MRFILVKFKDSSKATYNMEELKVTRGFLKVIDGQYGNVAFPMHEIQGFEVEIVEDEE